MLTFDPKQRTLFSAKKQLSFKFCKNKQHQTCNWLIPIESTEEFCTACQLNRIIPDLSDAKNVENWRHLEVAKHRLIYQLQKLHLPLKSKHKDEKGLGFDFVVRQKQSQLMTGHANGIVTILLREADSVFREKTRRELSEPYRTLIGHFRHEVGHYFWDVLISTNNKNLNDFRKLFGDERQNYGLSLQQYYKGEGKIDWQDSYISKYASSHPWEDWAETWAHYLHIMDMVETAYYFGIKTEPKSTNDKMELNAPLDPYKAPLFDSVLKNFIPLTFAVNSINRSMGVPDVYPFVVSSAVVSKMKFIHQVLTGMKKRDEYDS
ncbi:hypothetical protein SAMN05661096_00598 [Marivirga sericea]|uniref:Zinc-ribbon domain-containing protein n=2 Tax=Marivirga sericea TaxID=1028 RepID=A0A1X7IGU4_9BACT|nr:hypothetical protein SAMN05661096_00598 [Marivirga sericea]